jgi:hypothetical protein
LLPWYLDVSSCFRADRLTPRGHSPIWRRFSFSLVSFAWCWGDRWCCQRGNTLARSTGCCLWSRSHSILRCVRYRIILGFEFIFWWRRSQTYSWLIESWLRRGNRFFYVLPCRLIRRHPALTCPEAKIILPDRRFRCRAEKNSALSLYIKLWVRQSLASRMERRPLSLFNH